jgi:glycerate-2-kinase
MTTANTLASDALSIWQSGVDAVRPEVLIPHVLRVENETLFIRDKKYTLSDWDRIVVIGGGKAGAAMANAVIETLGPTLCRDKLTGWVNVPENCVEELEFIQLHGARPAGVNEPTSAGVEGTQQILKLARSCETRDLCLILISGGGSALMPAPVEGITLADKQSVTRHLMLNGATINELNCVRKQLSAVKGGRLAHAASGAGEIVSLIISDVVGDPLDVIASGPAVGDSSTPQQALIVLDQKYGSREAIPPNVKAVLEASLTSSHEIEFPSHVSNLLIGSNQVALDAAKSKAKELGYGVRSLGSENEGDADEYGVDLANLALRIRQGEESLSPPVCILSGGEPTVTFAKTDQPRKGGRNQQLVLSALTTLQNSPDRIAILSGGTDGEDGPTDAAGAFVDAGLISRMTELGVNPDEYRDVQNAYPFFAQLDGLIITGPTNTNVMDLRVVLVGE